MTTQNDAGAPASLSLGKSLAEFDPGLAELEVQRTALAARRTALDDEQRAIIDAYHRQESAIFDRFNADGARGSMSFETYRARIKSAGDRAAAAAGQTRSKQIDGELAELDREHAAIDRVVRDRRAAASRRYCEEFRSVYRENVRAFVLRLIEAAEAYDRVYLPMVAAIEADGVLWGSLGEAFFPSLDGHLPFRESELRRFLHERVLDGHLSAEDVPPAWRSDDT